MLILGRGVNERIAITVPPSTEPTRIEVIVIDNRRGRVRLGFEAPRESARIVRTEVEERPAA